MKIRNRILKEIEEDIYIQYTYSIKDSSSLLFFIEFILFRL